MVKSVELTIGKDANTRIGELTLDAKAKVTATTHPKVRKGWRVIAIAGKKVKPSDDLRMTLGMAQGRGKPYKVRFALPKVVKAAADGDADEEEEEPPEDDEIIYEEIDEEEWEGEEGEELFWADVAAAEAEAAEAAAKAEAERRAAALAAAGANVGKGKKKVFDPFAGKI